MTTYPHLYAAAQDRELLADNEWLHIDAAEWDTDPLTAPVYVFPEAEMEDLAEVGQAQECVSGTLVPAAFAGRDMQTLCGADMLDGVVFNLAKWLPDYRPEQLLQALEYYLEYDTFYEAANLDVQLHLWVSRAEAKDLALLKARKAALEEALNHPAGGFWVHSNRPQLLSLFLHHPPIDARIHDAAALGAACAAAGMQEVNAVYVLAAELATPLPVVDGVVYLGCFAATVNADEA